MKRIVTAAVLLISASWVVPLLLDYFVLNPPDGGSDGGSPTTSPDGDDDGWVPDRGTIITSVGATAVVGVASVAGLVKGRHNFIPIKSYSGGDLTAEKAEASSGSSQHDESTIGHNVVGEVVEEKEGFVMSDKNAKDLHTYDRKEIDDE